MNFDTMNLKNSIVSNNTGGNCETGLGLPTRGEQH